MVYACQFAGITTKELRGKVKTQKVVKARVMVSYMLLYNGLKKVEVGKLMNRSHGAIIHHEWLIMNDRTYEKIFYDFIVWMCKQGVVVPNRNIWEHGTGVNKRWIILRNRAMKNK